METCPYAATSVSATENPNSIYGEDGIWEAVVVAEEKERRGV